MRYEVEVKVLLGTRENVESLLASMRRIDPHTHLLAAEIQKNHYFTGGGDVERLVALIEAGEPLPFDLAGAVVYYMGPSPAKPGTVIGSAGPTTSGRMDAYAPLLMRHGLKGMIGKGLRTAEVKQAMQDETAVYFAATGGAGALLAKCIVGNEVIAYPELGAEAIARLEVKDYPVTGTPIRAAGRSPAATSRRPSPRGRRRRCRDRPQPGLSRPGARGRRWSPR